MTTRDDVSRRRLLRLSGAALAAGVAGCVTFDGPANDAPGAQEATPTSGAADSVYARVYRETVGSVVLVFSDTGQGSGFVFDDGHVVTNAHVVEDSDDVQLRLRDGGWRTGEVVGTDVYSDLAAVELPERPSSARPLTLIEGDPTVGQEVVVIGNPFGLEGTVTAGIVSGINRSIPSPAGFSIPDAVQTDAAANPGNSGGPIVSLAGNVVAVLNSGQGDNVAFGISAALAGRVVPELIADGRYEHSLMGVSLQEVTPPVARANGLDSPGGVVVEAVQQGGPADGVLRPSDETEFVNGVEIPVGGDVVVAIDDREVTTLEVLGSYLALQTSPGDTVTLTVLRDGSRQTVDLTLGTRPPP